MTIDVWFSQTLAVVVVVCKCLHTLASLLVCCFASWIYSSIGDLHMLVIVVRAFSVYSAPALWGVSALHPNYTHICILDARTQESSLALTHKHTHAHTLMHISSSRCLKWVAGFSLFLCVYVCAWDVHVKWFIFRYAAHQCAAMLPCCLAAVLSVRWHFSKFKRHKKYSLNNIQILTTFRITLCYLFALENVCLTLAW